MEFTDGEGEEENNVDVFKLDFIKGNSQKIEASGTDKVSPKNQKRALTTSSLNSRRIACTFTIEITLIEELRKLKKKYKINIAKFINDSAIEALKEQYGIDVHDKEVLVSNIRSYISNQFTSKLNYFFVEDIKGFERDNLKIKTRIKQKQFSTHLKNIEKFLVEKLKKFWKNGIFELCERWRKIVKIK